MTVKKKRKAIGDFCFSQGVDCRKCPHGANAFCESYSHLTAKPKTIKAWYKHFFGDSKDGERS